jgi:hypothetical protein
LNLLVFLADDSKKVLICWLCFLGEVAFVSRQLELMPSHIPVTFLALDLDKDTVILEMEMVVFNLIKDTLAIGAGFQLLAVREMLLQLVEGVLGLYILVHLGLTRLYIILSKCGLLVLLFVVERPKGVFKRVQFVVAVVHLHKVVQHALQLEVGEGPQMQICITNRAKTISNTVSTLLAKNFSALGALLDIKRDLLAAQTLEKYLI